VQDAIRRLTRRFLVAAACWLAVTPVVHAQNEGDAFVIVGAGQPAVERMLRDFAAEMEDFTDGRAKIAVESGLVSSATVLDQVQSGERLMGWVPLADVAHLAPALAALTVPYLFADPSKPFELLEPTKLGPLLSDQLREVGLEPLAYFDLGGLHLAGTGDPAEPDAAGQELVARSGELTTRAFEALASAESSGDAVLKEVDDATLVEMGDEAKGMRVSRGAHAREIVVLVAKRDGFEDLALDIQETTKTKLTERAAAQRNAARLLDTQAIESFEAAGGQAVDLPEERRAALQAKVREVVEEALRDTGDPSILRTILAYAD